MLTKNVKDRRRKEKRNMGMTSKTEIESTRHSRKSTDLMDPTWTNAYHGWRKYLPWHATTEGTPEKNFSTTVVEVFRRPCIPCPLKPQRMKFVSYYCKALPI